MSAHYLCLCWWRLDNRLRWLNHTLNLVLTVGKLNHSHLIPTQRHLCTSEHETSHFSAGLFLFFYKCSITHVYVYTSWKCVYISTYMNSTCAICDSWEAVIVVGMETVWSEPSLLFSSIATADQQWDRFCSIFNVDVMLSMTSTYIQSFYNFWMS